MRNFCRCFIAPIVFLFLLLALPCSVRAAQSVLSKGHRTSSVLVETLRRIDAKTAIQEDPLAERVLALEKELPNFSVEERPLAKLILAEWFWNYTRANQWKIAGRTVVSEKDRHSDFRHWDLVSLISHMERIYEEAFANKEELLKTPLKRWENLLRNVSPKEPVRPTLYDFFAFRVLDFYKRAAQILPPQAEPLVFERSSAAFANSIEFLKADFRDFPRGDFRARALFLFQDVLKRHASDANPTAFLDANLLRLQFVDENAQPEEGKTTYKKRLREIVAAYPKNATAALAHVALARFLVEDKKYNDALAICRSVVKLFPKTLAATEASREINRLLEPWLQLSADGHFPVNSTKNVLTLSFRNLKKAYFRIYAVNGKSRSSGVEDFRKMLREEPTFQFEQDLKLQDVYAQQKLEVRLPSLPAGFYVVVASGKEDFSDGDNLLPSLKVQVSNLAIVFESLGNRMWGRVLDAVSGAPVAGAAVSGWRLSQQEKQVGEAVVSNAKGQFEFTTPGHQAVTLVAEKGNDKTVSPVSPYLSQWQPISAENVAKSAVFFTDRALYRPGQNIAFKVLLFARSQAQGEFRPLTQTDVDVELRDANAQLVKTLRLRTNEMGSAAGNFAVPAGRLLGRYELRAAREFDGAVSVGVEEYKRPQFFVQLEEPKSPVVLGQKTSVEGVATTYAGVPIAHATVRYQVRRVTRMPWWQRCCFGFVMPSPVGAEVELLNAKTTTNSQGKFVVSFVVSEDKSVDESHGATFAYSVQANVLDATGEERSADVLFHAGYTDRLASLEPSENLSSPFPLKLGLTSLSGKPLPLHSGELKIFRLQEPERVLRARIEQNDVFGGEPSPEWRAWKNGALAYQTKVVGEGPEGLDAWVTATLAPGAYRAIFVTKDSRGKDVLAEFPFFVLDDKATKFPVRWAHHVAVKRKVVPVGESFEALWGTGYDTGTALVEVFHRGKIVSSYHTPEGATQYKIVVPVKDEYRGGFHVRISFLREHRFYSETIFVEVPWKNKELVIEKNVFRSNLKPGQREEWKLRILDSNAQLVAAEMVATLFDASLDAIMPHSWNALASIWPRDATPRTFLSPFAPAAQVLHGLGFLPRHAILSVLGERYPEFAPFVWANPDVFVGRGGGMGRLLMLQNSMESDGVASAMSDSPQQGAPMAKMFQAHEVTPTVAPERIFPGAAAGEPTKVRSRFSETAFFFPDLHTNDKGDVTLRFVLPDALTTWKFLAFAHTKTLQSGALVATAITSKELMMEPLLPRFLRAGDTLTITARVSNTTQRNMAGEAFLRVLDAETRADLTNRFLQNTPESFRVGAKGSTTVRWNIAVPADFVRPVLLETIARGEGISDGEEEVVPVLSKKIFQTESKTFSLRKPGTHALVWDALRDAEKRKSVVHGGATLEYAANAHWTVVQALGSLMETSYESADEILYRLYANTLGAEIVAREPLLAKAFAQWKKTGDTLVSSLERNESLKNVINVEMPWLREAQNETAMRAGLAALFDAGTSERNALAALQKLFARQLPSGAWSWCPGGHENLHMTLSILTGLGRMEALVPLFEQAMSQKFVAQRLLALRWVEGEMARLYRDVLSANKNTKPFVHSLAAQYLFMRTLYQKIPKNLATQKSDAFWREGAQTNWRALPLLNQAQVATAFWRTGDKKTAQSIGASLRERSLRSEEMGVWWADYARTGGWWFDAPVETQAALIELFSEMGAQKEFVNDMKVWLVQQKRTRAWHSSRATADAVFAILLRGDNPVRVHDVSRLFWGSGNSAHSLSTTSPDSDFGNLRKTVSAENVSRELASLKVEKSSDVLSFGSLHWQYFVDLEDVTQAASGIRIHREILKVNNVGSVGAVGSVVREARVGDTLRVRIVVETERDYEYVHLKDLRGTGFEPELGVSGYRVQDGLWYYETSRDTASSFFIEYLPKGRHVFEHTVKVQHAGSFDAGFAEMQCLYAPEFGARSAGGGVFRVVGE